MRSSSGARTDPLGQSIGAKVCFGVKVEDDDGAGHLPFTGESRSIRAFNCGRRRRCWDK